MSHSKETTASYYSQCHNSKMTNASYTTLNELLDALESKYADCTVLIFRSAGAPSPADGDGKFTEDWFFSDDSGCKDSAILVQSEMGLEMLSHLNTIQELGVGLLGIVADGNSFELSPYGKTGGRKDCDSFRACFAQMLAFVYHCNCFNPDWYKS
jgi:hypothetical protein